MTQETLEEAAEYHWKMQYIMALDESTKPYIIQDFITGANWQQQRMYSEEEVESIARDAYEMGRKNILIGVFNKWFEQFKNKQTKL